MIAVVAVLPGSFDGRLSPGGPIGSCHGAGVLGYTRVALSVVSFALKISETSVHLSTGFSKRGALRIAKGELHVLVCHWRRFHVDLIAELVISLWDYDLRFASLVAIHLVVFCLKLLNIVAILDRHD